MVSYGNDQLRLLIGSAHLLKAVSEKYVFRVNDYYLGLIDWNDPDDPIRQLIIPREEELIEWGRLDASNEAANTVVRGVQHKYTDTVLLLCNEVCGAYCRYCLRQTHLHTPLDFYKSYAIFYLPKVLHRYRLLLR